MAKRRSSSRKQNEKEMKTKEKKMKTEDVDNSMSTDGGDEMNELKVEVSNKIETP